MLADSGFELKGSAAETIGTIPSLRSQRPALKGGEAEAYQNGEEKATHTKPPIQYVAASKFQALLTDQNIESFPGKINLRFDYSGWNWWLCISTGLFACLSITPYIPLVMADHATSNSFPTWAAPLLRSVGSALSAVVAQMIIQIQVQRILKQHLGAKKATM
jgi:hypothetical protein